MAPKRKRLTLKEKVDIINIIEEENLSLRQAAKRFDVGKSTISNILQTKNETLKYSEKNGDGKNKRKFLKNEMVIVNNAVFKWLRQVKFKNKPMPGTLIKKKATEIAEKNKFTNFSVSNDWLEKFRKRYDISYTSICEESERVDMIVVNDWFSRVKHICNGYAEKDVYNLDETGLFYRALPDETMLLQNKNCNDGKLSKDRLTVVLCVNSIGEFENPVIIGRAAHQSCFRNIDIESLGIVWKKNTKSWMTKDTMIQYLTNLNIKMKEEERNILLFMDNAACHPSLILSNVKIVFFPAITTAICQPLEQGIIKNFKVLYRKKVLSSILTRISLVSSAHDLSKQLTVLDAIIWIKAALSEIKHETVTKCFNKCGFSTSSDYSSDNLDPNDESKLEELVNSFNPDIHDNYALIDENLVTEKALIEISDSVQKEANEKEDSETQQQESRIINSLEALEYMNKLKNYFLHRNDVSSFQSICDAQMSFENACIKITK
ncbi:tigger transposable element-derived protein 6-like [Trichogramma pretiosum]|uniref:tigger transposable element-derived protein 6-like n=1 Tax=Trichogramma pretiosum TaxID=7493 RepID=UPI000C719BCE|nr:tigger transposable element-derived protein 6-like [Trichogramma pretiosum]XP_023317562.1 tigger transposable element-derived protein 6-like [Trichogramma pretiosum]